MSKKKSNVDFFYQVEVLGIVYQVVVVAVAKVVVFVASYFIFICD